MTKTQKAPYDPECWKMASENWFQEIGRWCQKNVGSKMASQIPLLSPRRSHNWRRSIKENDPRAAATKMSSQQNRMFRHLTPVRIGLRSFDRWLIKIEGKNISRQQRWAQTMCRLLTPKNCLRSFDNSWVDNNQGREFFEAAKILVQTPTTCFEQFFIDIKIAMLSTPHTQCGLHTNQIQRKLLSPYDLRGPLTSCQ